MSHSHTTSSRPCLAIAGTRSCPGQHAAMAGHLAAGLVTAGYSITTGCATGIDAAVVAGLAQRDPAHLLIMAAFGPVSPPFAAPQGRYSAPGAWSGSAVAAVAGHLHRGGSVRWWAGGGPSVPLVARLASRTHAVIHAATAGVVLVFAAYRSSGTLLAGRLAVQHGLPVFAIPFGIHAEGLPVLGAGAWQPCAAPPAGIPAACRVFLWVPAQSALQP